ncbi:hypothetical protein CORC01_05985 [Colletotrichum orchidophilum]|uniref:Cyclin-dependent kinase n=1 Tax=Colletotrichum orchidophilum TaxID=1209926 RepID=A0A1G4BBF8_9PEZI|nr:uncharacterized protein CORC01_05985 [Colletotrichum orchidophilum]OHE98719.1 hypothetical protein CORC01_05985 [Colletotrichum orchidophilum]
MNPPSPAKRRALAPLDANVNAMLPTKLHKHSKLMQPSSPRKSPVKALNLKRPLAAVDIFDENAIGPNKKHCQEPASAASLPVTAAAAAAAAATAPAYGPEVAPAPAQELALASEAISPALASASGPAPTTAPAQTEMDVDVEPDAIEDQSEESEEQKQDSEQQPRPEIQGDDEQQEQQEDSRHETPRTRSVSPDTSAVFDTSAMDTSQNTTILTEPDAEQARTLPPPRPRRLLTREEARQKAQILRLKLGLANYKLQTGQENVPLDRLQVKPRPGQQQQETKTQTQTTERALPRVTVQPPSSRDGPPEKEVGEVGETKTARESSEQHQESEAELATQQIQKEREARNTGSVLSRLVMGDIKAVDDDEPTRAVSGGVVSSLLSLARGSSSSVSTSS